MIVRSSSEVQNNFGKYLSEAARGEEIIITKNGKETARLVPSGRKAGSITDSLRGILKGDPDEYLKEAKDRYSKL